MLKRYIARLVEGESLTAQEAREAMSLILDGKASPWQAGGFLVALQIKGFTAEELTGCALAMKERSSFIEPEREDLVDISGTGGDRVGTFNISTTAAFVVAGAGLAVAKHGAKAVSSRCGSAELLESLGVNLNLKPEQVARCIDEVGIGFVFAPAFHPALQHVLYVRKEVGVRTVMDLLGPLVNPAGARAHLLGVYDGQLTELVAKALDSLGSRSAFVVYGADGLDELSTTGVNKVSRLDDGSVSTFPLDPHEVGMKRAKLSDLQGGDPAFNASITRAILEGEKGPRRDIVVLNAAAALIVGGKASGLTEGIEMAAEAIDSGRALEKLRHLVEFTNR